MGRVFPCLAIVSQFFVAVSDAGFDKFLIRILYLSICRSGIFIFIWRSSANSYEMWYFLQINANF